MATMAVASKKINPEMRTKPSEFKQKLDDKQLFERVKKYAFSTPDQDWGKRKDFKDIISDADKVLPKLENFFVSGKSFGVDESTLRKASTMHNNLLVTRDITNDLGGDATRINDLLGKMKAAVRLLEEQSAKLPK